MAQPSSPLEGSVVFPTEPPLSPGARDQARRRFYHIVDRFDSKCDDNGNGGVNGSQYKHAQLIRLTYNYAQPSASQDNYLRAFFCSLGLSLDNLDGENSGGEDNTENIASEDIDSDLDEQVRSSFFGFADYLIDNFFLPIKATGRTTPQPSPAFNSAIEKLQAGDEFEGTLDRLSALRGACLVRDRHRCVVSRSFDSREGVHRLERDYDGATDDDGALLKDNKLEFHFLEVAHILPRSLPRLRQGSELDPSKQAALVILNMFDNGVGDLIGGTDIDRPRNALTLTFTIHNLFSNFDIFFEPVPDAEPHTYRIGSFLHPDIARGMLPAARTVRLTESSTIDTPSPRLLAIHRAIGHILYLSAAGRYIDKILDDVEDPGGQGVQADGSTNLGRLVHLGLWLGDASDPY